MKKNIVYILTFLMSAQVFAADPICSSPGFWSSIKANADGSFQYSSQQNLCVGQLVQDNKVKDQQINDYTKAIQLKDLALTTSDTRTMMWQKSADDEMDRLNKIEGDQKRNDWLYFGLGVITTIGAGFMAAKIIKN